MGSSPILIGAGNKLIGGLSALGAGCCEFKSHFLDKDHIYGLLFIEHKSMLRESMLELVILFPVMATLNILIIMRENSTRFKKIALEWSFLTLTATLFYGLLLTERSNFKLLKNWSEFPGRRLLRWMVSPSFFKILTALLAPICGLIS